MAQTFLVVDDSRIARALVKRMLSDLSPGCAVAEAQSAEDAFSVVEHRSFDVILMDINMAGLDGLSAAARIMNQHPGQRIALVTANLQVELREMAQACGIAFITKPLQKDDLAAFLGA